MKKGKSLGVEIEESIDKNRVSSSKAQGVDVRAIKTALNKLYFYTPPLGKGITTEVDDGLFEAIKDFQRRYFIPQEQKITNDSLTLRRLNEELDNSANFQLFKRSYIWKTTQDKHVRGSHAARAGQVFLGISHLLAVIPVKILVVAVGQNLLYLCDLKN